MKISRPSREDFQNALEKELALSDVEKRRIADFSFADERTMEKMWSMIALSTKKLLTADYRDGRINFYDMLEAMRKCSLGLPASHRAIYLGSVAEFGIVNHRVVVPKKIGQRLASYPRWFKRTLVDVFDMVKSCHPDVNNFPYTRKKNKDENTIYKLTVDFLSGLNIFISPDARTVEKWLGEIQNKDVQSYRTTKKHRTPDDN